MEEGGNSLPLNIKDPEAHRMARELSRKTGQSLTTVVREALRERLARERGIAQDTQLLERVRAITSGISKLPLLDTRSDDEILGYDEHGTFR